HKGRKADCPFACTYPGCTGSPTGGASRYQQKCGLNRHIMSEHWGVPAPCSWPGCSKTFAREDEVKRH
ncbi:uncharacterized protein TRAVEDRAFT_90668, partial [Trametes versicolor FP-101664 SS1]|uniref:uncharacterized protein n=1 Tax=Trametes versicolor (strain FP-101664) TaxID=717944 RepID=UPI0004621F78